MLFVVAVIIITQQMLTNRPLSLSALFWDKSLHFSAWALLVALGCCSCRSRSCVFTVGISVFLYSVCVEALQGFVGHRTFSLSDILANGFGCLAAMLLAPRVYRRVSDLIGDQHHRPGEGRDSS